jgi:hypothetical protein
LTTQPITYRRVGDALVPKQKWLFDRGFVDGQEYELAIHEPRSTKSHDHYHATVREAWKNLPEKIAKRFPDADALRKFALIRCDFYKERTVVCDTEEAATQVAALAGSMDDAAVVTIQGTVVTVAVARSQKTTGAGAMNKEEFQRSKQAVLEYIANLIGVDVATLSAQIPDSADAQKPPSDAPDTPAAELGSHLAAAGVNHSEASTLSDDWRSVYIQNLSGVRDRPASLLTRHGDACCMIGGEPNQLELAWMRKVWRLVQQRNEGDLKPGEYEVRIETLKNVSLAGMVAA